MPEFARGLAAVGARVFGLGDQPEASLPEPARAAIVAHLRVDDLWDERAVIARVAREAAQSGVRFDRVECLWEPGMLLAARLREALGIPGLDVAQTVPFRDKERMKQVLDAAGIRTPWHARARSAEECRAAARQVGFPLIVKPIAGAGARDTYRVDSAADLDAVLPRLGHVLEVSVEEFVEGDELTYDTICAGGRVLYENVALYRTRPLEERKHEWVSPSAVCLREIDAPDLQGGRRMGHAVLAALGFHTGFTHMEWYRTRAGEVVFGEIGARPPGARLVHAMNCASDVDLFTGWAEAVCHGRLSQPVERTYNAALVAKRAQGGTHIRAVTGLDRLLSDLGPHVALLDIRPIGAERGDWRAGAPADGWVIVRHPDLPTTLRMADRFMRELQIHGG